MKTAHRRFARFALALALFSFAPAARAQTAPDASDDASPDANADADGGDGGDGGGPVCPASDERGPCLDVPKNSVCTLSTTQSGACVESACLTTASGAPALVCRADAAPDQGCCSIGGTDAATPAVATMGFGFWMRRRRKRLGRR